MKKFISIFVFFRYGNTPKEYVSYRNDLIGKYIDALAFSTFETSLSSYDVQRILSVKYSDRKLHVYVMDMGQTDSIILNEIYVGYFDIIGKFHSII